MVIDNNYRARWATPTDINIDEDPNEREKALEEALKAAQEEKERQDYLMLSAIYRAQQDHEGGSRLVISAADTFNAGTSKPSDSSSGLTRRLVSAKGAFEVRQVISDAHRKMVSLRMIASMGGEDAAEARRCLRKLEKVVSRGQKKVRDLTREDGLKADKKKAKQKKQQKREEQIKTELRRRQTLRSAREQGYVLESTNEKIMTLLSPRRRGKNWAHRTEKLDPAHEALIARQAAAKAEAEQVVDSGPAEGTGGEAASDAGGLTMGGNPPGDSGLVVGESGEHA